MVTIHPETPKQLMLVLAAAILGALIGIVANWPDPDPYASIRPTAPTTPIQFSLDCSKGPGACRKNRFNGHYFLTTAYYAQTSTGEFVYSPLGRVSVQKLKTNSWDQIVLKTAPTIPNGADGIAFYLGSSSGFFYQFNAFSKETLPNVGDDIWNGTAWKQSRKPNAMPGQRMTYHSNKFGFKPMWAIFPAVSMVVLACIGLTIYHYFLR